MKQINCPLCYNELEIFNFQNILVCKKSKCIQDHSSQKFFNFRLEVMDDKCDYSFDFKYKNELYKIYGFCSINKTIITNYNMQSEINIDYISCDNYLSNQIKKIIDLKLFA